MKSVKERENKDARNYASYIIKGQRKLLMWKVWAWS